MDFCLLSSVQFLLTGVGVDSGQWRAQPWRAAATNRTLAAAPLCVPLVAHGPPGPRSTTRLLLTFAAADGWPWSWTSLNLSGSFPPGNLPIRRLRRRGSRGQEPKRTTRMATIKFGWPGPRCQSISNSIFCFPDYIISSLFMLDFGDCCHFGLGSL